jgi:hypothetical protein
MTTPGLNALLNEDADHQDERHAEEQDDIQRGDKVDELGRHRKAPSETLAISACAKDAYFALDQTRLGCFLWIC